MARKLLRIQAEEAKAQGLDRFVPDDPCRYGHYLRYTICRNCVECLLTDERRIKAKNYAKEYRKSHKESTKKYVTSWQKRHPEKMQEYQRRWKESHKPI